MEKRIRVVWVLSLVSVLLLIGVQAYWLYNQYEFVLNEYTGKLVQELLETGDKEFKLRKSEVNHQYSYIINTNSKYTGNKEDTTAGKQSLLFEFLELGAKDSASADSIRKETVQQVLDNFNSPDVLFSKSPGRKQLSLTIDTNVSQDSLPLLIDMAIVNNYNPFRMERFDSLLTAGMPGYAFEISAWPAADSLYRTRWERTGNILHPEVKLLYAYSPFQHEGICLETTVPVEPLLKQMAAQLLLAFGITLLLIACLVFQIQTILRQQKIGELRQNFVNTMIHELKRPVQTLKTFIAFLGDKEMRSDETIAGQVVQDSMFELDNLSAYLNKLRDMVRADSGGTPLNLTLFNLRELTEKVVRLVHIPEGKKVEFTTLFDRDELFIKADPVHLANVLSNLIENAVKYSGNQVDIEIKACRKGNQLQLTVSDNGMGIPMAEQERVFAKFYRGSNLPDSNIPGLGLGLSYVKLISEAHQGHVTLQSYIGKGTSITLCLPQ